MPSFIFAPAEEVTVDLDPCVMSGLALLEERVPDWRSKINKEILGIESPTECVLGQLFGHYERGCEELWPGLDTKELEEMAMNHSFQVREVGEPEFQKAANSLTEEWLRALAD